MRSLFPLGVIALILFALPGAVAFAADLLGYGPDLNLWAETHLGISHRLALGIPPAIIFFCIPPIIVLLYFLRLKRRPLTVASTYLWKKSVEDLHVNRLMQWMRRNVLLLLQLLAILLLIYTALGPRTQGALTGGRHYIILLDNSSSMNATDVAPTRLDWAKAEALKLIDAANEGDPGMLIVFNSTAEIRQSYTNNKDELRAAVKAVAPSNFQTRIDEALVLAASRANPGRSTENAAVAPSNPEPGKERTYFTPDGFEADVYLLSDGRFPAVKDFALQNLNIRFPEMPDKLGGGRSDNVGIISFDASREGDRDSKLIAKASIANYRENVSTVKVWLDVKAGDGTLVKVYAPSAVELAVEDSEARNRKPEEVLIPAKPVRTEDDGKRKGAMESRPENVAIVRFNLEGLADSSDIRLEVRLEHAGDAFKADDQATLVFGVARKANVLVVTPGNRVLRFWFDTTEAKSLADFAYVLPEDYKSYVGAARDGKYDLIVFDRTGPETEDDMPAGNTLFIGYPPPPYIALEKNSPNDKNSVIEVKGPRVRASDRRHPLMKDIGNVEEVGVDTAFRLPFLPPRTPRLLEGDRDLVLLAAIARQAYTDLVLTFPIVVKNEDGPDRVFNSNWPLQPKFPLFLRAVVLQLGNVRYAGVEETLRPGQMIPLRPGSEKIVFVTKPGATLPLRFDRGNRPEVAFSNTDELGVYSAEWGLGGSRQIRRFAVNLLDPEESDLAPVGQFQIGTTTVTAGDNRRVPMELWKLFLALGLVIVVVEWWIYNRRVQI